MQLNSKTVAVRKGFPSFGSFSKSSTSLSNKGKRKHDNLSEGEEESARVQLLRRILLMDDDDDDAIKLSLLPKKKRRKRRKYRTGGIRLIDVENRSYRRMHATESTWFMIYVKHPRVDSPRFLPEFRRRFRVPYQYFVDLNNELEGCEVFNRWHNGAKDMCGIKAAPISILLLAALRYIGRAWTVHDLHEAPGVSEEVI
jgi:hypothetical protein